MGKAAWGSVVALRRYSPCWAIAPPGITCYGSNDKIEALHRQGAAHLNMRHRTISQGVQHLGPFRSACRRAAQRRAVAGLPHQSRAGFGAEAARSGAPGNGANGHGQHPHTSEAGAYTPLPVGEALRQSEERLRAVVAGVPGLISTFDRNGIYTFSDGRALGSVGLRPGERVGQSLYEVHRDRPDMRDAAHRALQGEPTITIHEVAGQILENHWSPLRDATDQITGILCIGFDITARVAAEAEARAAAERYQHMFETNRAIKLVVDAATGSILDANSAACDFYGYSREELTARRIWEINADPEAEARAEQDDRLSFTTAHRLASGAIRDVEVYSGPVQTNGRTELYSIIHDVTERKRAEQALQHQALHDALTDLPNRALLQNRAELALRATTYHRQPVALLLL
ncbi:MAG TPA: PAS domain S-box protein, partial [Chloroflexota bacterium]|nr:PAS domain S-box protein [Chloroflexota bacterium]